jgi:hypothetical protein
MKIRSAVTELLHKELQIKRHTGRGKHAFFATPFRERIKNYQSGVISNGLIFGTNFTKIPLFRMFCTRKMGILRHSTLSGSQLKGEFSECRSHLLRLRHFKVKEF